MSASTLEQEAERVTSRELGPCHVGRGPERLEQEAERVKLFDFLPSGEQGDPIPACKYVYV